MNFTFHLIAYSLKILDCKINLEKKSFLKINNNIVPSSVLSVKIVLPVKWIYYIKN